MRGTNTHVGVKHLQKYTDKVAFKPVEKDKQDAMFEIILSQVV
jgi:hypothetical protein